MRRLVGKWSNSQFFHDLCYLLPRLGFRVSKIQHAEGDILLHIGAEDLMIRLLKYNSYLTSEVKEPFSGIGFPL